eukprot:6277307-Pyramimonas_sp.AAC.1
MQVIWGLRSREVPVAPGACLGGREAWGVPLGKNIAALAPHFERSTCPLEFTPRQRNDRLEAITKADWETP